MAPDPGIRIHDTELPSTGGLCDFNGRTWEDEYTVPARVFHPAKKDTKSWCRGHVGRLHRLEWAVHRGFGHNREPVWYTETCTVCGKQFRMCWPWSDYRSNPRFRCLCGNHE